MPIQNSMPFKGKTFKSYKSNVMQTAVNYFSFVMEITDVDFSIFSYFWITVKNHQRKVEMKTRPIFMASKYMHQIASTIKALQKIQSDFNSISSLTDEHHYTFLYSIPPRYLSVLFTSP